MILLSIDTSTKSASVSLTDNGVVKAKIILESCLTHSESTLTLINDVLNKANISFSSVDAIAVTIGPGSFTGLRIGIATVKGLAITDNKPCYPVSTLLAYAYAHSDFNGFICPTLDARRNQVYTALFKSYDGVVTRIMDDTAISVEELGNKLSEIKENIILVGDGCKMVYDILGQNNKNILEPDVSYKFLDAIGIAKATNVIAPVDCDNLYPSYIRLSQAERERNEKLNK